MKTWNTFQHQQFLKALNYLLTFCKQYPPVPPSLQLLHVITSQNINSSRAVLKNSMVQLVFELLSFLAKEIAWVGKYQNRLRHIHGNMKDRLLLQNQLHLASTPQLTLAGVELKGCLTSNKVWANCTIMQKSTSI